MKKGALLAFFAMFLSFSINFISAYSFGSYGQFSFSDFLNDLDPSTVILTVLFIVFFGFIYFTLLKFFNNNSVIAGVLAFALSFGLVYGINQTGFNFDDIFYSLGIPIELLYVIGTIAIIVGGIYFASKQKLGVPMGIVGLGAFFFVAGVLDWVYESFTAIFFGIVLIIVGAIILNSKSKKKKKLIEVEE